MSEKQAKKARQESIEKIEAMAAELLKLRDVAVLDRHESGCEKRMRDAEEAFDASIKKETAKPDVTDYAAGKVVKRSPNTNTQGSQVTVNTIRGRTEVTAGRFASAAMPTDERNFELTSTPDPELDEQLLDTRLTSEATGTALTDNTGKELAVRDVAMDTRKEAEKRMTGMQQRIDDQFVECSAHTEFLKGIYNSAKRGTGVIKGPFILPRTKTKWVGDGVGKDSIWTQKIEEILSPVLKEVSAWDCYPSPGCGDNQRKMSYHWERGTVTPGEIRQILKMAINPDTKLKGYLPEQLARVLKSTPVRTAIGIDEGKKTVTHDPVEKGYVYETWEYHGEVTVDAIKAMGIDVETDFVTLSAVVLFINDIPVKAALYPLDNMGLIYHYFQWSKVSDSLFGRGIPESAGWVDLVLTGLWRAWMDNAHAAAGGYLIINGEKIIETESHGAIKVMKVARDTDVRTAMAFFKVQANQAAYQDGIEMALRFLDLETTTPMAFQGDKVTMPETLGATNILVDSGNVAIENRLPWWESDVMFPILKKFYDFNMADPDCPSEIKGDYSVACRGVKSMQNRELEAKEIENIILMKNDPDFKYKWDWDDLVTQYFKRKRINIKKRSEADIKADEDKAAQQPPPQDPSIEAANIRTQGEIQKATLVQEADMAEIKAKAEESERQREHERWEKMIEWQIKQGEITAKMQESLEKIKAKLVESSEKMNLQRELSGPGTGGEALTPPTEPGQKAAPGMSYQD